MFVPEEIFKGDLIGAVTDYRRGVPVSVFGAATAARAAIEAAAARGDTAPTLVVAGDFYLAKNAADELRAMEPTAVFLPARDDVLACRGSSGGETALLRLRSLYMIASGKAKAAVCPAEAIMQLFPRRESFLAHCFTVQKGGTADPETLTKLLVYAGYKREEQLSDAGRFSLRGDILDVWSACEERPARIEFFGDEVESIRYFDADDQLSDERAERYEISPFTEFFAEGDEAERIACELEAMGKKSDLAPDCAVKLRENAGELAARVRAGDRGGALSYLLPIAEHGDIISFGNFGGAIYDDVKLIVDNAKMHLGEHRNRFATLLSRGETLPFALDALTEPMAVFGAAGNKLAFQSMNSANRIFAPRAVYTLRNMELPAYFRDFREMASDITNWLDRGYTVYLSLPDRERRKTIADFLGENGVMLSSGYGAGGARAIDDRIERGGVFHDEKIVIIGERELSRKEAKKKLRRSKKDVFAAPEPGEYVVHDLHGVGRFEGMVKLEVGGARRDYLLVTYAGGDKLYVPVESMDQLSKYVADGGEPKLNKLGGADFAREKEKVRARVRKLAFDLVELYGERLNGKGYRYNDDDSLLDEFSASFEYAETEDQLVAVEEGLKDLKSGKLMDRLLCGDVGYGKTEVALRLAFKVISEGKQVAFLSPTTILAKQHYETVKKRMEPFGVRAVRLTRFDSPAEQAAAIKMLKAGKADIAVGTHRLLSSDVDFADLGLLILDEEQRFGVSDKEKIKNARRQVNVLALSATPIPRTLHMSMTGIRDISVLDTPPLSRIPVQTYVMEYGESLVVDAVTRELGRGGQAFIVYNRVADIATFAARIAALLPSARVAYAHGQMREETLERTVSAFADGETDVLVTSTIIENGIDIPRANTMIVVDADRLGLSQLYQLRGRVGRSDRLAYVFFTFDGGKPLSDAAYKRLEAITQFTEFGSGFRIAMRDLELRGAGTVLGAEQHGHMEKVGYDMYCKLLGEAVGELRGEKAIVRGEVTAAVDYGIFLPDGYVTDKDWRLRVYSRIARVSTLAERDELLGELADVYGPVPTPAKNLIDVALMKNRAATINAVKLTLRRGENSVSFRKVSDISEGVHRAATAAGGALDPAFAALRFPSAAKLLKFLLNAGEKLPQND